MAFIKPGRNQILGAHQLSLLRNQVLQVSQPSTGSLYAAEDIFIVESAEPVFVMARFLTGTQVGKTHLVYHAEYEVIDRSHLAETPEVVAIKQSERRHGPLLQDMGAW